MTSNKGAITKETKMTEEELQKLKKFWYNRWKDSYSWLEMANTLKTSADNIHDMFLDATNGFIQRIWENAEANPEGNKIKIKGNLFSYGSPEMKLYPVYMSQAGYALENLFKGIIISGMWLNNSQSIDGINNFIDLRVPVKGGANQPMPLNIHLLNDLLAARDIHLNFGKTDRKILKKLTDFILWGGRYPIPLQFDTGAPIFMRVTSPYNEPEEHEIIENIYDIAKKELDKLAEEQRDKR
jgi:hypothetical protein